MTTNDRDSSSDLKMEINHHADSELPPAYIQPKRPAELKLYDMPYWQQDDTSVVAFYIRPHGFLGVLDPSKRPWDAVLSIRTKDLPRLMRDGLFWGEQNISREAGHLTMELPQIRRSQGRNHCRIWHLACEERDPDGSPFWVGKLSVYATELDELLQLRPAIDLRKDSIYLVTAGDHAVPHTKRYYSYRSDAAQRAAIQVISNYNVIYDDMPLQGWWPWPRLTSKD